MMKKLWTALLMVFLLAGGAVAAFIQSPIPPSSKENFLVDRDGDGRLDGIEIQLLGSVDQNYLNEMIDSLTLDWADSSYALAHIALSKSVVKVDAKSSRAIFVDLADYQSRFLQLTSLVSSGFPKGVLGNVKMHMSEGTVYTVPVQEKMAPVIKDALLRSYSDLRHDTLSLEFSEGMKVSAGCETFLTYKRNGESAERSLPIVVALWSLNSYRVRITLGSIDEAGYRLAPKDSIRLKQNCIGDSLKNMASKESRFIAVAGYYPMQVQSSAMVADNQILRDDTPIFQLLFEKQDSKYPNDNEWGYSLDAMDDSFLNMVRKTLGMPSNAALDRSKLQIHYNLRIYTNLGTYVVGTSFNVMGNDPRFEGEGKKLFLKWNVMDGLHRRVGTGVYIADFQVYVTYDGETIYRNDDRNGITKQIFGVKRR